MRIVRGGLIDTTDITCGPGDGFSNWIQPTKQKLLERERKLCLHKLRRIEDIVNTVRPPFVPLYLSMILCAFRVIMYSDCSLSALYRLVVTVHLPSNLPKRRYLNVYTVTSSNLSLCH